MMKMNLQFFGGRSSAGGNAKASAESRAEAKATTRTTADERNARENARVQRENRLSGVDSINALKKGESYDIDMGRGKIVQGTYLGGTMINGIAVHEFRNSVGRVVRIDGEDVQRSVRSTKDTSKVQFKNVRDLDSLPEGTVLHTSLGGKVIKQSGGIFTQTGSKGQTLSGMDANQLFARIKSGKMRISKRTKSKRKGPFGDYI